MSFDGYSFCKAHSASYARVSYQAAYLKIHYPAEFMAAVISNRGGYYSTFAYVSEAKRLGLQILPPCVNKSGVCWQGRRDTVRVGLLSIKSLSAETMLNIVRAREEKDYVTTMDFWQRVQANRDENRALIQAGALDSLSVNSNRSELFWELAQFHSSSKMQKTITLFTVKMAETPALQQLPRLEQLRQEYQVLGFLCNDHPLLLHGSGTNITNGFRKVNCHHISILSASNTIIYYILTYIHCYIIIY